MPPFPSLTDPTPQWLTAVLRDSGVLPHGELAAVEIDSSGAFNSQTSFLRLHYSADAPPSAPTKLVLKRSLAVDWAIQAGIDEVNFYRQVSGMPDHPPVVPPCLAAAVDPGDGSSYLLLVDLSDTHAPPITRDDQLSIVRGVPCPEHQAAVVDALAALHAYWWEHPLISSGTFEVGYRTRDEERFSRYLARREESWQRLLVENEDWFPTYLRDFYERLFVLLPQYWERVLAPRFRSRSGLTLTHGDAYFCNFLCPKIPASAPTYLVDWQSPSFDLPGNDLANLLAAFWTRAQRLDGDREGNLLHCYHAGLLAGGVTGYAWQDLVRDYQAGLIFWALMPVQDGGDGAGKDYWWPKMQCLNDAFEDWACWEAVGE